MRNSYFRCRSCKSPDFLSTIEQCVGYQPVRVFNTGEAEWTGTASYNESLTIGVSCSCGWMYEGPDWIDQLRPAGRWVVVEDSSVLEIDPETGESWTEHQAKFQSWCARADSAAVFAVWVEEG